MNANLKPISPREKTRKTALAPLFGIALTWASFCATGTANAQSNFQPGQIIDANGDSIQGWIDQRDWQKNPKKITFKTDEQGPAIHYTPTEISAFSVLDERYESAIVSTCVDPVSTNRMTRFPELTLVLDTVFLRVIMEGKKSLFYAKNDSNVDNFYIETAEGLELLRYKRYLKVNEWGYRAAENKSYLLQLQNHLEDFPGIAVYIPSVKYNLESLSRLFCMYNECTDIVKDKKRVAFEAGACIGGTSTAVRFRSSHSSFNFLTRADFGRSYDATAGFFLNVVQNKRGGQWALSNDVLYTSFGTNGRYTDYRSEGHYVIHTTELAYSYIKISNMLQYRIPVGAFRVSFNAGLSYGLLMGRHNSRTQELFLFSLNRITEDEPLERPPTIDPGYFYGFSIQLNRWGAELRREQSDGVSSILILGAPVQRTFLMVKYRIW